MLYPVIGSSIKFNLIYLPKIFIFHALQQPRRFGRRGAQAPHERTGAEARAAVKDAERGTSGAPRSGLDP